MPNARIIEIRNKIDEYLSKAEVAGVETFSYMDDGPSCVQAICRDLKVERGSVLPTITPAKICINGPGGGGAPGADTVIEAGEKEAWKDDNRKKLAKAKTDERHIVVYIHISNGLARMALTSFEPLPTPPRLPSEITHIWLISEAEESNEFVIWYASVNEPWDSRRVTVPMENLNNCHSAS